MTTPARIVAFLSTSAQCLGLADGSKHAGWRGTDVQRESQVQASDLDGDADAPDELVAGSPGEVAAQSDGAAW